MLVNLFVIYFLTNAAKQYIDACYKNLVLNYNNQSILMNEFVFSFLSSIVSLFMYCISYLIWSYEFLFIAIGVNVITLIIKLNHYNRVLGKRLIYSLYLLHLITTLQTLQYGIKDPMIEYTVLGAIIVLLPEPLRYMKMLVASMSNDNAKLWLMMGSIIITIDKYISMLFKSVIAPIFCFIYIRAVPNLLSSGLVFMINTIDGLLLLLDQVMTSPDIKTKLRKYVPKA